jgi:molybdopterin-guanine dinucleotide biosynthesis protein A
VVEGRPIIVRQVEVLQSVTPHIFVVGTPPDRYDDLGLPAYPDVVPATGALGGIYTALVRSQTDLVLVVACDLPFLSAGLLEALIERSASHDGAWVVTERGAEPLLACYRSRGAATVRAQIDRGLLKAARLSDVLDLAVLGPGDLVSCGPLDRLLANVNTPEDHARVKYGVS